MKKLIIACIAIIILGAGAAFFVLRSRNAATDISVWQTYQNQEYGVLIKYPADAAMKEASTTQPLGLLVSFTQPDKTTAIFHIASQSLDIDKILKELAGPQYASANIQVSDISIAGIGAKKISGQTKDNQISILYIFNHNDRNISLTVAGEHSTKIGTGMISTLMLN